MATATFGNTKGIGVKVWEAPSGWLIKDLPMSGGSTVGFSPDGKWLVTTFHRCRLWAVGSWEEGPFIGKEGAFAFSPDCQVMAVRGGEVDVIRLVEPATGREYPRLDAPGQTRLWPCCFTPDGTQLIALGSESQALHVWDLRLVRRQLAEMGLDWDAPPYPEPPEVVPAPIEVRVVGAEQADPKQN